MSRQLATNPVVLTPGYGGTPPSGEVLTSNPKVIPGPWHYDTKGSLVDPDVSAYDTSMFMYASGFYGDYYNHVYMIPVALSLVDPVVGFGNVFYFWSTYFSDITITGISALHDTGLSFGTGIGLTVKGIKLTPDTIVVASTAPQEEIASYTFSFSNSAIVRWSVDLVRTNFLGVPPQTPIIETLKWKTDVIEAKDSTEQRIATVQYARIEHEVNYLFLDDSEQLTIYEQLVSSAVSTFTYPLWAEQVRLMQPALSGASIVKLDTVNFDLQEGDSIYLDNENGQSEQVQVSNINVDGVTCSLSAGLLYNWSTEDHVYRVTQVKLPSKPELQQFPFNRVEFEDDSSVLRIS